jgi:tRNA(Ile2) C34 agmatinyltransferase TiaS
MLGALLGPIALILVLLIPSAKADTKVCPDCAESVKEAAVKCRFCGYRFDQPEIVPRIT